MEPFDDEDYETGGVPDLATRTWRHPSEVAASLAADSAHLAPSASLIDQVEQRRSSRQPVLSYTFAAVAAVTAGLVFAIFLRPSSLTDLALETETVGAEVDFAGPDAVTSSFQSIPSGEVSSELSEHGVFGADGRFLAGSIVMEDMGFTSASALNGETEVAWRLPEVASEGGAVVEVPATVVRILPDSDIAVLEPKRALPGLTYSSLVKSEGASGDDQTVSASSCSQPDVFVQGQIRHSDVQSTSIAGVPLTGLSLTSIPSEPCFVGSPVFTDTGEIAGMVVAANSPLTLFVPLEQLAAELD